MLGHDSRLVRRTGAVGGFVVDSVVEDRGGEIDVDAEVWIYFQPCVTRLEVRREDGKEGPGWRLQALIHVYLSFNTRLNFIAPIKLCLGSFSDMWLAAQTTE
jgi:hypothetical protein